MFACRTARGLLAQREYEELTDKDGSWLEEHLERCAPCRREAAALSEFPASPPATQPELAHSILPRVRAQLETPPSPNRLWRWAASGLAVAMLALIGAVALRPEGQGARVADRRPAAPASASVMGRARELMDQSQPHKALVVLRAAVEDEAAPQGAGALYGLLGDAAFQTRRYEEAHRYYEEARRRYEDEWLDTITPERSFVVNLLAETRPANYMPLHDLDFAGSQGGEALAEYERILARHPGAPHLASLTTARMCELVAPSESGAGPETRVAALRALREQCGDPVAAGQLDIELGRLQQGLGELEAARTAFERASSAPDPAVAERAEGLLARVRAEGR